MGPNLLQRIVLATAVMVIVACSWLAPIESTANRSVDAGLKRALASFATARALNAVISTIQGTEFAAQPMGVGFKLAPGKALQPVNDMVEQFAHLMLVASIAFGMEKMLITIGSYWVISLLLTTIGVGWAYLYLRDQAPPRWLTQILLVLLMTRFAIPVAIIGSDLLFQQFMEANYQSSQKAIEAVPGQIEKGNGTVPVVTEEQGVLDNIKNWGTQHVADIKARFVGLIQAVDQTIEYMISLIAIFLLQTLVLPLFLLWVLWGVARGAFEVPRQGTRVLPPR